MCFILSVTLLYGNFFDIKEMYADSFNPLCLSSACISYCLHFRLLSLPVLTVFQRKLADFDILGIISILELLKCLDIFHVEANNMLHT